jgi:hypothetical protein
LEAETQVFNLNAELAQWSRSLPLWQQYAVSLLCKHDDLSPEQVKDVCRALLAQHSLGDWESDFTGFVLGARRDAALPPPASPPVLKAIRNVRGVNALSPGQTLPVSPSLTVVYGANASGKSGYARLLAHAMGADCGSDRILPDVYQREPGSPSADLVFTGAHGQETRATWTSEGARSYLSGFRFFSSDVAVDLLTSSGELSIGPSVLRIFPRLANLMDGPLKQRLSEVIAERVCENRFAACIKEGRPLAQTLADLGPTTDLEALRTQGKLTDEERGELSEAALRIAEIQTLDIDATAAQLQTERMEVLARSREIAAAADRLSDVVAERLTALVAARRAASREAQDSGTSSFSHDALRSVGCAEWRQFIALAAALAAQEAAGRDHDYPADADVCLFCQQRLSEEAIVLVRAYWKYLRSDAEERLQLAQRQIDALLSPLNGLDLDQADDGRTFTSHVSARHGPSLQSFREFLEVLRTRRAALVAMGSGDEAPEAGELPCFPVRALELVLDPIEAEQTRLRRDALEDERARLAARVRDLQDRDTLGQLLCDITGYVRGARWVATARTITLDTRSVTLEQSRLFDGVVTEAYKAAFRTECERLGCSAPVIARFRGEKAKRMRWLDLDAQQPCKAAEVLSEGERRVVALAAFLTDVNQNPSTCGVVFDDPVSSLDAANRQLIAARLVAQATHCQVIVFTHALDFLMYMRDETLTRGTPCVFHWVERTGARVGHITVEESPATEASYRTPARAREAYHRAHRAAGSARDTALHDGFVCLKKTVESLVCNKLLAGVVQRFEEHIRVGNLRDVRPDPDIVNRVLALHTDVCKRLHLEPDTVKVVPPDLGDLDRMIHECEGIIADIKAPKSGS